MGVLHQFKAKDYATLVGTFSGIFSIYLAIFYKAYRGACFFVFISVLADLLDGYIARKTKTFNDFGKELDSLSDAIAFGVAPGLIAFISYTNNPTDDWGLAPVPGWIMLIATFIFIAGAIARLAWFNVREGEGYEGIPTPISASGLSLAMLLDYSAYLMNNNHTSGFNQFMQGFIPVWMVLLAYFNVTSHIHYDDTVRKKGGNLKYIFLLLAILVVALTTLVAVDREAFKYIVFTLILSILVLFFIFLYIGFRTDKKMRNAQKAGENSE